jgi:hypothetical protein
MIFDRKWPVTLDKAESANLSLAVQVSLSSLMAG